MIRLQVLSVPGELPNLGYGFVAFGYLALDGVGQAGRALRKY